MAYLVPPEIKEPFAEWVLDILKPLYSADPQILGDYVFALLEKKTEPIAELRQLCLDELQDFLREHTEAFVNLLFAKLKSGFGPSSSADRDNDRHSSHASHRAAQGYGPSRRYDEQGPPRDRSDYYGRSGDRYYDERSGRASGSGRTHESADRRGGNGPVDTRRDVVPRRDRDDFYSSTDRQEDTKRQRSTGYEGRRDGQWRERDYAGSGGAGSGSPSRSGSRADQRDSRGAGGREAHRGGHDDRDRRDEGQGRAASSSSSSSAPGGERHHDRDADRHRTATDPPSLTTILVEHVPDHHNNVADLIEQFGSFGRVITATAKPSQQKAFIQFATKDQAEAALSSPNPIFNNRFITITMANRSKHAQDPAAWASSKPTRGGGAAGRGSLSASVPRPPLPSRDQLKLVKPSAPTEEASSEQDDADATSSSAAPASTSAPVKPAAPAVTKELLQRQLEAQNEILELLGKPGLKPETRAQLKQQLRSLIESSESGVTALNSTTKQAPPPVESADADDEPSDAEEDEADGGEAAGADDEQEEQDEQEDEDTGDQGDQSAGEETHSADGEEALHSNQPEHGVEEQTSDEIEHSQPTKEQEADPNYEPPSQLA